MANMDADELREAIVADDAARRRWWLLTEAAKDASLREALEIARAAEAFLAGDATLPASHNRPVFFDEEAEGSSETETSGASESADTPGYLH